MSTLKRFICPPIMGHGSQGLYIPLHIAPAEVGPHDLCDYAAARAIEEERDALKDELLNCLDTEAKTSKSGIVPVNKQFWAQIRKEREALREVLTALLREHDSAPDAKGSDAWDAARKLLEGK